MRSRFSYKDKISIAKLNIDNIRATPPKNSTSRLSDVISAKENGHRGGGQGKVGAVTPQITAPPPFWTSNL